MALVVGCGVRLLDGLHGDLPDGSAVVIEEPELIGRRELRKRVGGLPVVADLFPGAYLFGCDPPALLKALPDTRFDRVIPATNEASAVAAAELAAALGLPGAGPAAATFADKLTLRATADAAGLRNPRWREVTGPEDLVTAFRTFGGNELVLKPSGRSGSQGVQILTADDDATEAWRRTVTAEGLLRPVDLPVTRYLVEERLYGDEVSVECLVSNGGVVFHNVTAKDVLPGRHPVEIGHRLPAELPSAVVDTLREAMRSLVTATGFDTGILHGEWILGDDGPVLVECAARIPGDQIMDLHSLAYGIPFWARYSALMAGERRAEALVGPGRAGRGAAVRYLLPPPGVVRAVAGTGAAAGQTGVTAVEVKVAPGDRVRPVRASADRSGHVVAVGADAVDAWQRAGEALSMIEVETS